MISAARTSKRFVLASILMFGILPLSASQADGCQNVEVYQLLVRLAANSDPAKKMDAAAELVGMLEAMPEDEVDSLDTDVVSILQLQLQTDDDGVRMWVATALRDLGPLAISAIPALRQAAASVRDNAVIGPVLSNIDPRHEIEEAITFIQNAERLRELGRPWRTEE